MRQTAAEKQARYRERVALGITKPRRVRLGHRYRSQYTTRFICTHENIFVEPAPVPGELQWCSRCMDYQEVTEVTYRRKTPKRVRREVS